MVEQPNALGVSQRFSSSIQELREFLASRGVSFGSASDLQPFLQQLAVAGPFADEMGSMVRTVSYTEENLSRAELLEIVTVSVAGPLDKSDTEADPAIVRQIFLFLNAALRQGHTSFADVPDAVQEEPPAEVYVAPPPQVVRVPTAPAAPRATAAPPPAASTSDRYYRAMSLSAAAPESSPGAALARDPDDEPRPPAEQSTRGAWWVIPAIGLILAAFGAGIYMGKPYLRHASAPVAAVAEDTQASALQSSSCVAPIAAGVTRSGLQERALWAHNLLAQKLYDAALPELREIRRLDPGYPAIALDESDALLHLKRPEEARDAINAQIQLSECLSRLPAPALEAYCAAHYARAAVGACHPQLTHIRQAAELQAALVHLELGHQVESDGGSLAALEELNRESAPVPVRTHTAKPASGGVHHVQPLPPATEGDTERPVLPRETQARPASKKGGDASLVRGEGTDSAYGAYQRP